jgi:hypothetical protein
MSLAEKKEMAEQLRGELAALRVEKEHILHTGNIDVQDVRLDEEIERLQNEVNVARAERDAAVSGGSVDDALEAMRLAAAAQGDNGSVDLATPAEVHIQDSTTSPDTAPESVGSEATPSLMDLPMSLGEPITTDAPKADGE